MSDAICPECGNDNLTDAPICAPCQSRFTLYGKRFNKEISKMEKDIYQLYGTLAATIADIVNHPMSERLIVAELVALSDRLERLAETNMTEKAAAIRRDLVLNLALLTTEDIDYMKPSSARLRAMVDAHS